MTGSSIAGRDAAPWVTDFLNAAYYRRAVDERDVDDLRFAFGVLTTYWYSKDTQRRLHLNDLAAFHRPSAASASDTDALGARHAVARAAGGGRGALLGDWFPEAYADDARRGWGIAFETVADREAYDPERAPVARPAGRADARERAARASRPGTPTRRCEMPSAEAVIDALTRPETWPDYASEIGRFTPLRPGGLDGQTFEIEVAAGTDSGRPIFTRGYVTITTLVTPDDPEALRGVLRGARGRPGALRRGRAARGARGRRRRCVGFDLTTHQGHFMGSGHNRLLLYDARRQGVGAGRRDVGPDAVASRPRLPASPASDAQHAFWGQGDVGG